MTHAWCRDPSRDERVRAAEDGRTSPLPTLEECIAGVTESMPGDARGEEMEQGNCAEAAERSATVSKTGDGQRGLRTERVTLEITHDESFSVSHWSWVTILRIKSCKSVRVVEVPVDSVDDRAYADSMACDEERDFANRILAGRDAAIRERDDLRKSWLRSEESGTRLLAERNAALDAADGLRKRVAELEAASGGGEGA